MGLKHPTSKSFSYAWQGLKLCFRYEPNFRIHLIFAAGAIAFGWVLGLESVEWLMLVMTIFLVIILELLNTVLEAIVDLVSPDIKPAAKKAKDVSAAMVLVSAIFSIVVGLILFLPKILFLYY
ncbi:diacylglycerol kinase family protein [Patescibacteria group bacterium]